MTGAGLLAAPGFPEPFITELGLRLRFVFPLKETIRIEDGTKPEQKVQVEKKSRLESRLESRLVSRIILLLRDNAAGKAELARLLGHTTVSGELHKQIRRLAGLGWIEMTIPEKPKSRKAESRNTV